MAAGLGFKTFTTGEVLTAGDVNGYLMQGINVFTNATARDAAITAPAEGQFAFTKDNNTLWYYDGAAWVASGATGDIEGVTAGVGISGGGTSGTVTITNSMATAIDAKGDLVAGTGADAFSRLAVGTNNQVLTADSAQATGMKWATPAGGGKILQVVTNSYSTVFNTSSTTYVDTGLSTTITPTANTSRILVMYNGIHAVSAGAASATNLRILRGATNVLTYNANGYTNTTNLFAHTIATHLVDSPATTSATTYKIQISNDVSSNITAQRNNEASILTLLEIGA
jgi:hypothetical protein